MSVAPACLRVIRTGQPGTAPAASICMDGSTKSACPPDRKESTAAREPACGARTRAAHWHERRMSGCFPSVFQGEELPDEDKGRERCCLDEHKAEEGSCRPINFSTG